MEAPPIVKVSPLENPSPLTKITAAIIKFLDFVRSTLFSTTFLTPIAEIIPYSINETPPIIADGIDAIISDTFGIKLKITAKIAAIRITRGSYTLESSSTPVFSPYVVLAGPPTSADRDVARPSPTRVRCRPGSSIKFSPTVAEIADISPICSIIDAIAIGAITRIAVRSNLHN